MKAWGLLTSLSLSGTASGLRRPEWEWNDDGSFLRFRSANRDIYRAAMLPQWYLDWVDGLAAPYLPEPGDERTGVRFTLDVDPVAWIRQTTRLTDMQMQYGASIGYGDPSEPKGAVRQALLSAIAQAIPRRPGVVRFCGALSDEQWAKMQHGGLTVPDDVSLERAEPLLAVVLRSLEKAKSTDRSVIEVHDAPQFEGSWPGGGTALFVDAWEGDDRQTTEWQFAARRTEVDAGWPG